MTTVDLTRLGLVTPKFDSYWIKYGDTLYKEYKIIYLVVVGDENDFQNKGRISYRKGLC